MSSMPSVSVLLPVYNGSSYLHSILNQDFKDFELIIIDDGSSDDSAEIIKQYSDPRIHYFYQDNQGLASTLNRGINLARGNYIARQDQDDVSTSNRLSLQVNFLDENPGYAMVGSAAEIWANGKKTSRVLRHPTTDAELRFGLLFRNYFVHSSVLIRRNVLMELGGYCTDPARQPPEDYELWCRISRDHKMANLIEPLVSYHEVSDSMSRQGVNPFQQKLIALTQENIEWAVNLTGGSQEALFLSNLMHKNYEACELMSWEKTRNYFDLVVSEFSSRTNISINSFMEQIKFLRRYLGYCYIDYLLGGVLNKYLKFGLREKLKTIFSLKT
jgi:glycosyltransferase involved in cell wall biosynthesis